MAVITELIDAGLQLKRQGNLRGAIEHFRQLHATYPGNARIMFELAASWTTFEVPEQALPLYRELLALPKGQGLPPKDIPRLYTRLGAALLTIGEVQEALAVIDEGLRLHPSYRPLRVWRIFALNSNDADGVALLDALELMLESLAPSRWDIFEDDIVAAVKGMRAEQSTVAEQKSSDIERKPSPQKSVEAKDADTLAEARRTLEISENTDSNEAADAEVDVAVQVKAPKKKPRVRRRKQQTKRPQLGKKAVRIDISAAGDSVEDEADDDDSPPSASAFKIPVDAD